MPDTLRTLLDDKMRKLAPILHTGLAGALVSTKDRLAGFGREDYGYLYSHTVKASLRETLLSEDIGRWTVEGNPKLGGQLLLEDRHDGISMKVAKENRRVHPGGIPPAGRSKNQQGRYSDARQLRFDFPLDEPVWPLQSAINLHLLWDYGVGVGGRLDYNAFSLRVVHTTAPSRFGRPVPVDLAFEIEAPDSVFVRSRFAGDDAFEDLFFELDDEVSVNDAG